MVSRRGFLGFLGAGVAGLTVAKVAEAKRVLRPVEDRRMTATEVLRRLQQSKPTRLDGMRAEYQRQLSRHANALQDRKILEALGLDAAAVAAIADSAWNEALGL